VRLSLHSRLSGGRSRACFEVKEGGGPQDVVFLLIILLAQVDGFFLDIAGVGEGICLGKAVFPYIQEIRGLRAGDGDNGICAEGWFYVELVGGVCAGGRELRLLYGGQLVVCTANARYQHYGVAGAVVLDEEHVAGFFCDEAESEQVSFLQCFRGVEQAEAQVKIVG